MLVVCVFGFFCLGGKREGETEREREVVVGGGKGGEGKGKKHTLFGHFYELFDDTHRSCWY